MGCSWRISRVSVGGNGGAPPHRPSTDASRTVREVSTDWARTAQGQSADCPRTPSGLPTAASRIVHGRPTDFPLTPRAHPMHIPRTAHGLSTNCPRILPRIVHERLTDASLALDGLSMGNPGRSTDCPGHPTECPRAPYGLSIDTPMTPHAHPKDCPWTSHRPFNPHAVGGLCMAGLSTGSPWGSRGVVMGWPRASPG